MAEETKAEQTNIAVTEKEAPVYHKPELKKVAGLLLIFVVLMAGVFLLAQHIADNRPVGEKIVLTVDDLVIAMSNGPNTTEKTYKGQYVELTGTLAALDSQGDYVRLAPLQELDTKTKVCGRINDEQFDYLKTLKAGETVTVTGTITNVGTVLGIFLDVEDIE